MEDRTERALLVRAAMILAADGLDCANAYGMKADRTPLASHIALVRSVRTELIRRLAGKGIQAGDVAIGHLVCAVLDLAVRSYRVSGGSAAKPAHPSSWTDEAIGTVLETFASFPEL